MSNWGSFPHNWPEFKGRYAKLQNLMPDDPFIPSGAWRMIANGRIWDLDVVDGMIVSTSGPGSSRDPLTDISVEWERGAGGTSLRIMFSRRVSGPDPDVVQKWIGYLMTSPLDSEDVLIDDKYRIAGTFEQIEESGRNNSGGWYATIDRVNVTVPVENTCSG